MDEVMEFRPCRGTMVRPAKIDELVGETILSIDGLKTGEAEVYFHLI